MKFYNYYNYKIIFFRKMKHHKELERIVKGFANNWRIKILELIENEGPQTLAEITDKLKMNMKTASSHTNKLNISGLISKRYNSNNVIHRLSDRGKTILKFLRILE